MSKFLYIVSFIVLGTMMSFTSPVDHAGEPKKPTAMYIISVEDYKSFEEGTLDIRTKTNEINNPKFYKYLKAKMESDAKAMLLMTEPLPEGAYCPNACCVHYYPHQKCWWCAQRGADIYIVFEYCFTCVGCGLEQS